MSIKERINAMKIGDEVTMSLTNSTDIQRIRNFAFAAKTADKGYSVTKKGTHVTVSCFDKNNPDSLTAKLKLMKQGEIIHPVDVRHRQRLNATVAMLGGGYRIRTVMEVEKL